MDSTDICLLIATHLCFAVIGYCVGMYIGGISVIRWRNEIDNKK